MDSESIVNKILGKPTKKVSGTFGGVGPQDVGQRMGGGTLPRDVGREMGTGFRKLDKTGPQGRGPRSGRGKVPCEIEEEDEGCKLQQ